MDMAKTYEPKSFETKLYNEWNEKGYFVAKVDKNKNQSFRMIKKL